ncbi:MAG: DUF3052 domain-containing protein [Anaerolineae bacterium]|nr:DUF3052 domain-containing protein [Anaerolineae bacterium]
MTAGYSKNPLSKKLGLKTGQVCLLLHAPGNYQDQLEPLPEGIIFLSDGNLTTRSVDFIQLFTRDRAELIELFPALKDALKLDGMLWVSWPKKAAKVPTDLDGNIVREIGLAAGLVDVKVVAVDAIWSGLKFVYRLEDR